MAKKQQQNQEANEQRFLNIRRGLIIATVASIALVALLWGGLQLEHFLIRDPQFTLASPPDPGRTRCTPLGQHSQRHHLRRSVCRVHVHLLRIVGFHDRRPRP